MINIGIIGTGFGAKVHVPGFRAIRGVRVLGIAGHSAPKTARLAKELNIPIAFSSWKELVRHPDIHAVSIATPPLFHKKMALFAAKHRKHIFCEKPLATSASEARVMFAAVKRARVVHGVDFEFRNLPGLLALKKLLAKKSVGSIRHVRVAWLTGTRASITVPLSWQNKKEYGGGVLFSHGSHVVDYMEMLFGKLKNVSARLVVAKQNGATAEDTCDMLFKLANGATANVSISNVLPNVCCNLIEIYGDKGSLKLENRDPKNPDYGFRLFHFSSASNRAREIPIQVHKKAGRFKDTRVLLFGQTAEKFIRAIRQGKTMEPSFADGLRVQQVLGAARASSRSKKSISVD